MDERVWSVARWGHALEYSWVRSPASTYDELYPATLCNQSFSGILPEDDMRICEGQLEEVMDDGAADNAVNAMRIRRPFDFAGRTGTVVWDVDAKVSPLNLGHGWWIEVWITEDPAPIAFHNPSVAAYPRNSVGFVFSFGADCPEDMSGDAMSWQSATGWQNALESVFVTKDSAALHSYGFFQAPGGEPPFETPAERCFRVADAHLNHFELRISQSSAELWASDYDDPKSLALRATAPNLDLPFTRGYVQFHHVQSNASLDGLAGCGSGDKTQCVSSSQTFRWDNIGFDGPLLATPSAYDVENNHQAQSGGLELGYYLDDGMARSFSIENVKPAGALSATMSFDGILAPGESLEVRFNGGSLHTFVAPGAASDVGPSIGSFTLPDLPLDDLVSGSNTIEMRVPTPRGGEGVGNLDLTLEVASE